MEANKVKKQKVAIGHYSVGSYDVQLSSQTASKHKGGWDITRKGEYVEHVKHVSGAVELINWWMDEEAEANRVPNCTVKGSHCEQCGGRDESSEFNQGYSSCCNELITDQLGCRDHHGAY